MIIWKIQMLTRFGSVFGFVFRSRLICCLQKIPAGKWSRWHRSAKGDKVHAGKAVNINLLLFDLSEFFVWTIAKFFVVGLLCW
jgi:hypothetical protein